MDSRRTVILVTHDPRIARIANRVLTIQDGVLAGDEALAPSSIDEVFGAERAEPAGWSAAA